MKLWLWTAALMATALGAGIAPAAGQDAEAGRSLSGLSIEELLNVTVVSPARREQRLIETPRSVSVITAQEIRRNNYRTVPEALQYLAGVFLQETNYGGGSPIIRGMVGNRILILVDGIRLNNAIYRFGPNQYLNTIDLNQVERIEVLRGPRSVLYGSDAFGGMINIITRSPAGPPDGTRQSANAFSRYSTADGGAVLRVGAEGRRGRLAGLGGVTWKDFGDVRAGSSRLDQPFTGYREWDGDAKFSWTLSDRQGLTASLQHVRQDDVPRTDKLATGKYLVYQWQPEQRDLVALDYRHDGWSPGARDLRVQVSYQDQLENVEQVTRSRPDLATDYRNRVGTVNTMAQMSSALGRLHLLTYGAEFIQDAVGSRAVQTDRASGAASSVPPNYVDGSTMQSLAFFAQDELRPLPRLALNLGVRHSRFDVDAAMTHAATGDIPIDMHARAFTGSAFASLRLKDNVYLTSGIGQGFRAPNLDDLSILGPFAGGFEVPNGSLRPEKSLSCETGLKMQSTRASGTLSAFITEYTDLIDRAPGLFNGLPFVDANGNGVQDAGEDPVFQRKNIGRARVYGFELDGRIRVGERWSLWGNFSWARGEDRSAGTPLTRIPPPNGILGLTWKPVSRRVWIEPFTAFADEQTRLSPADLADSRIDPHGTPGWATYNVRAGVDIGAFTSLTVALENITDKSYHLHGSGLDAPGRNLVLGLRSSLE